MITRVDWRASGISVAVVIGVGFVVGLVVNGLVAVWLRGASTSDVATTLVVFNLASACVLGLIYGALIGGLYVWQAGRRKPLDTSEALVGVAISVVIYMVIVSVINVCWSSTAMLMSLQSTSTRLDLADAGTLFFNIVTSGLVRGFVELVAALIAGIPTALVVERQRRGA